MVMARNTRLVVRYSRQLVPASARKVRRNERSEMPTAAHSDRSSTSARCYCVWRMIASTTGTVLVGSHSGASAVSSHSAVSSASAVKNASAVGSLA